MAKITDAASWNPSYLNNLDNLDSGGKSKLASWGKQYIRDRLREDCVFDKVITPKHVQPTDPGVQISLNHDTLYKIEWLEVQTQALTGTFRGTAPAEMIRADRVATTFATVMSTEIQKAEQELQIYSKADYPLTEVIEELMIKDMQEIKDFTARGFLEAAVQGMQQDANGGVVTKFSAATVAAGTVVSKAVVKSSIAVQTNNNQFGKIYMPTKEDFVNVKNLFVGSRSPEPEIAIMSAPDYNNFNLMTLQDFGSRVAGEVIENGWGYSKFIGMKIATSKKNDIFVQGEVWVIGPEDWVGRNYILNNMKFYVDKKKNMISWCAWFDWGMSIINCANVKKIELYGGSVTPGLEDAGVKRPSLEQDLGKKNNRAIEGVIAPLISVY
jgi:hypothetical protein